MSIQTFIYSALLIILGLVGYFISGMINIFPLIPTFFGIAILICGLFALSHRFTKIFMHIAITLALIGFFGTAIGIVNVFKMLMGTIIAIPQEAIAKSIMSLLSLTYVIMCLRWFLNNRRKKSPKVIV